MEKIMFPPLRVRLSRVTRLLLPVFMTGSLAVMTAQDDASKMCDHAAKLAASTQKDGAWRRSFHQAVRSAEYLFHCAEAKAADSSAGVDTKGDKQVGASGGTGGSTSLVSHGFAPSLLGFAFESGGIERDISGSVVTFRANPATLLSALAKKYGPGVEPSADPLLNTLSRVNLAATFDTSRTATASGGGAENPFRANYQQLTEFSARAAIWNGRDPFRRKNWYRMNKLAESGEAIAGVTAARELLVKMQDAEFIRRVDGLVDEVAAAPSASEAQAALSSYNAFIRQAIQRLAKDDASFGQNSKTFKTASQKLAESRAKLFKEIDAQAVVNIEYALFRPPAVTDGQSGSATGTAFEPTPSAQRAFTSGSRLLPSSGIAAASTTTGLAANPDISALRLVGTWKSGATDLTWNAAVTFFNSTRPGMSGRFRDFNTGGSASIALGNLANLGEVTATLAGRYMHLHQKPLGADVFFNSTKINTPGNIRWLQGKLTFPGPGKGVKIPLSFTLSNRTELIDEKDVRVNVGFSFDLDAIIRNGP